MASSVQITLKKLHLRVQTTAWNRTHDQLASRLANKHSVKRKALLTRIYDGGCVLGLAGMIVALCLLLWTAGNLCVSLIETSGQLSGRHEITDSVSRSLKRALDDTQSSLSGPSKNAQAMLKPIVSHIFITWLSSTTSPTTF